MHMPQVLCNIYHASFKGQYTHLPLATVDLSGKTVIISGANAGLGLECAKHIAAMNPAKLILAVRTISKGEAARQTLLELNPSLGPSAIEIWQLDLGKFSSVTDFIRKAGVELSRIDVLLCNAGIVAAKWEMTPDGWESTLQTNVLATFQLALGLLPLLNRTADNFYSSSPSESNGTLKAPHLTIVSSGLHFIASLAERNKGQSLLQAMNTHSPSFSTDARYSDTKLLEVFFVRALAKRSRSTVVVNSVNPGYCYSSLNDAVNEANAVRRTLVNVSQALLARTTEQGSRAILWAALTGVERGAYSANATDTKPSPFVLSQEGARIEEKLWKEVIETLVRIDPALKSVVKNLA